MSLADIHVGGVNTGLGALDLMTERKLLLSCGCMLLFGKLMEKLGVMARLKTLPLFALETNTCRLWSLAVRNCLLTRILPLKPGLVGEDLVGK